MTTATATSIVLAATRWNTNAEMVADAASLGFLRREWVTLDPTYGRGTWWRCWRPDHLVVHDLVVDSVDFCQLPHDDNTFDAVAYDPPYLCKGGRRTSGIPVFDARYGLANTPRTPAGLQELIDAGLAEMHRVVRPARRGEGGIVLAKCMNYVSGGKLWLGVHRTLSAAQNLGFRVVDVWEHVGDPGPQPSERRRKDGTLSRQQHARHNSSTLLILQKPPKRRRAQ